MAAHADPEAGARHPVAIVGAGALGLLFAAKLARVTRVAVIARDAGRAEALRRGVEVAGGPLRPEAFAPDTPPEADWVVILVKGPDTADAASIAARMRPRGVLSLQNGLVESVLQDALPGLLVGQGVTTEGAYREGDRVVHAGSGETLVPEGFEPVAALLRDAGLAARVAPAIREAQLAKLLVNLALNPLTALFRVPNGALAEPPLRTLAEALVREALPVLAAEGLALAEDAAIERVFAVARATGENRSSMLQDVLAGRRTELESITGAFLRLADRHGTAVPTHRAVYRLVKLI